MAPLKVFKLQPFMLLWHALASPPTIGADAARKIGDNGYPFK
jgi:hypothetical protein